MNKEFLDWLTQTQAKRDSLCEYGLSQVPQDGIERGQDMDRAISMCDNACRLLADAESFLTHAKAQAVLSIKEKYPDFTARERERLEADTVKDVQRIYDGLEITTRTIKSRIFSAMNKNRAH